jgi:nitroimidazol reductase NimA-like FMN-containing flavoprotein (pyridoxamine 5'-phosphate oxidase superfamily)
MLEKTVLVIRELDPQECAKVLSGSNLGRLSCVRDNFPYTVPISYVHENNWLYSFTLEGQKVEWMRENPNVCVLVDEISDSREWRTVLVEGRFEEFPQSSDWARYGHAWSFLQSRSYTWWLPGGVKRQLAEGSTKYVFYGVRIVTVTGRQALSGPV